MPPQGFSRARIPAIDIAHLDRLMLAWDDGIFDEAAELLPILERDPLSPDQPPKAPDVPGPGVPGKNSAESPKFSEVSNENDPSKAGESMSAGRRPALAA